MGTIADKLTLLNTSKINFKEMLQYANSNITDETTFRDYVKGVFDAYINILNNPDDLFNALPKKAVAAGVSQNISGTIEAPMRITLKASELSQDASPNPEYPQDIHTISGDNSVVVCGKNICDYDINTDYTDQYLDNSGNWLTTVGYIYTKQKINITSKTISVSIGSIVGLAYIRLGQFKSDGTFISRILINTSTNNVTLDDNCSYIWLSIDKDTAHSTYFKNISINYGSTATTYEPYVSQTSPINLDTIEYCKIGNYEDEFIKIENNINLPNEYTQVGYIESSGTQHIDTGVPMSNIIQLDGEFAFTAINDVQGFFGRFTATSTTIQGISNSASNAINFRWLSVNSSIALDTNKHSFSMSNKQTSIDGVVKNTYNLGKASDIDTLFLMARRTDNGGFGIQNNGSLRLYGFKIYTDSGQARNFIPCYRNSDNEVGLYDLVNNQFYTNSGTGSFTYGVEVNKWYLKKNIGKVVLDGSESWNEKTNSSGTKQFYAPTNLPVNSVLNATQKCNYFNKYVQSLWNYGVVGEFAILTNTRQFVAGVEDTLLLEDFKTSLANNNLEIYYILATPTYTQITGELANQLEQIYKGMLSYDGATNISQVNNDLPFIINTSVLENLG